MALEAEGATIAVLGTGIDKSFPVGNRGLQEEIAQRINHLAGVYQIPADKFLKDLQKRNGLIEIYDQIMNEKVIDLLQQNAKVEDVAPAADAVVNPS